MTGVGDEREVPGVYRALADVLTLGDREREVALAAAVATHDAELARGAARVVRSLGVPASSRAAALDVVGTVQRTLVRDVATGHRRVEGRAWSATLRFEAAHAARRAAAVGVLTTTPYRQRLAADRSALLRLRQAAVLDHAADTALVPALAGGAAPAPVDAADVALPRFGALAAVPAAPAPAARRARLPWFRHRPTPAARPARWGAATALSTLTVLLAATVAPAFESAERAPVEVASASTPGLLGDAGERGAQQFGSPFVHPLAGPVATGPGPRQEARRETPAGDDRTTTSVVAPDATGQGAAPARDASSTSSGTSTATKGGAKSGNAKSGNAKPGKAKSGKAKSGNAKGRGTTSPGRSAPAHAGHASHGDGSKARHHRNRGTGKGSSSHGRAKRDQHAVEHRGQPGRGSHTAPARGHSSHGSHGNGKGRASARGQGTGHGTGHGSSKARSHGGSSGSSGHARGRGHDQAAKARGNGHGRSKADTRATARHGSSHGQGHGNGHGNGRGHGRR